MVSKNNVKVALLKTNFTRFAEAPAMIHFIFWAGPLAADAIKTVSCGVGAFFFLSASSSQSCWERLYLNNYVCLSNNTLVKYSFMNILLHLFCF